MTVIRLDTYGGDGALLCPNISTEPQHPAHRLQVRATDAGMDDSAKHHLSDSMDLYSHFVAVHPQPGSPGVATRVRTWYWRCHICGLILPATAVE